MRPSSVCGLPLTAYIASLTLTVLAAAQTTSDPYDLGTTVTSPAAASQTISSQVSILTGSASATSSTSREPVTKTVSVGFAEHSFKPDVVLANVGDTIEFRFYPTNHSVVRSVYGYPCVPYEMIETDSVGFFSGFHAVDAVLADPPVFSVRVNDTEPIFFYCSAPGSCIDYSMVGAVNPNATQTVAKQKQLAKDASFMLQPGDPWPAEGTPSPYPTESAYPSQTSGSASSASSSAAASAGGHHNSGLSSGAIAGIVVGGVAGLAIIGVLFYLCGRNRALTDLLGKKQHAEALPPIDTRQSLMSSTTAYTSEPKHPSGFTVYPRPNSDGHFYSPSHPGSPGLPQYANLHNQGQRSPSLRGEYTPLTHAPQSDQVARTPSPGQAPAYSASAPAQELPQDHYGPHEMPAEHIERGVDSRGRVGR